MKQAIRAGIFNDLGSGSNVDVTVIRKPEVGGGTTVMRGFDTPNEVADLRAGYTRPKAIVVPRGATAVLSKEVSLSELVTVEDAPEPMAF